jgi:hypothetical protein
MDHQAFRQALLETFFFAFKWLAVLIALGCSYGAIVYLLLVGLDLSQDLALTLGFGIHMGLILFGVAVSAKYKSIITSKLTEDWKNRRT